MWALAAATPLRATEVGSEVHAAALTPVGGASAGDPAGRVTYLAVPVVTGVFAGGTIGAVDGARLTDPLATWQNNQFNGAAGRFYLQLATGAAAGWRGDITATEAATRTVVLAQPLPATAAPGDTYRIRGHATIAGLFGGENATALQPAGNPSDADNVLLFDAATQRTATLFRSVAPAAGWWEADYTPAGSRVIPPEGGFMLRRRAAAATALAWAGPLRTEPLRVSIQPGLTLVGLARSTASPALATLGLVTGDPATGLRAGANVSAADRLAVVGASGATSLYFYSDVPGFPGWFDAAYTSADALTFGLGQAFFVQRAATAPAFEWRVAAEE